MDIDEDDEKSPDKWRSSSFRLWNLRWCNLNDRDDIVKDQSPTLKALVQNFFFQHVLGISDSYLQSLFERIEVTISFDAPIISNEIDVVFQLRHFYLVVLLILSVSMKSVFFQCIVSVNHWILHFSSKFIFVQKYHSIRDLHFTAIYQNFYSKGALTRSVLSHSYRYSNNADLMCKIY